MERATIGEAEVVRASPEVGQQWGYLLLVESILRVGDW